MKNRRFYRHQNKRSRDGFLLKYIYIRSTSLFVRISRGSTRHFFSGRRRENFFPWGKYHMVLIYYCIYHYCNFIEVFNNDNIYIIGLGILIYQYVLKTFKVKSIKMIYSEQMEKNGNF